MLGWATAATAGLLIVHVLPAALGILSRETALVAAIAMAAATLRVRPRAPATTAPHPDPSPRGGETSLCAVFSIAAFGIWLGLVALAQLKVEPLGFDATSAYMPTAARWIQTGSIWELADWVPGFFFGSSPGNGSIVVLSWMLPWENDFAAHFAIYPFVALTVAAIYAIGRELGAQWPTAALIGLMLTAAPVVVEPGLVNTLLDPVLYAMLATGIAFLVRHARTTSNADLVVAGAALGIAFGTKYYGYTAVPIVIGVWIVVQAMSRIPVRALLRRVLLVVAPVAAFGGVWMIRNWVDTGNPFFPVQVDLLGFSVFDAPDDPMRALLGSSLADYFDDLGAWTGELRHQFRIAVGLPLVVTAGAFVAGVWILIRRPAGGTPRSREHAAWALVIAAGLLALAYAFTPYSAAGAPGDPYIAAANVRYGIPALIAAGGVAAWLQSQAGARATLALNLACLVALFDALRIGVTTPRATVYLAFLLAALVTVGAWILLRKGDLDLAAWRRGLRQRSRASA